MGIGVGTVATCRPSLSVPLYTCPMDAAAKGSGESSLKREWRPAAPGAVFSSLAMIARASSESKAGTASCSWRSSSAYASGIRSVRIDSAWGEG